MKCPNDGNTLDVSERAGIEINHCPSCQGVWLDKGELEKIVARSTERATSQDDYDDDGYHPTTSGGAKGFLRDLFNL